MIFIIVISAIAYFVIGRVIAEKRWEWDGYDYMMEESGIIMTTIFWPIYLVWMGIKLIASLFIDIDI